MYKCYLNGKFYGGGNLQYMRELFVDYVITHKMYGKSEVDFKIVKEARVNEKQNSRTTQQKN